MPEVLVEFSDAIRDDGGRSYMARACGSEMPDGMWQGWIEFLPDKGEPIRSGRETTQPNRQDTHYWATGLTYVYLEGALKRALKPLARPAARETPSPSFTGPAPVLERDPTSTTESVLNPFSVYRKGEALLRRQLAALSSWHLVNIVRDYELSAAPGRQLETLSAAQLVELIVAGVKKGGLAGKA